ITLTNFPDGETWVRIEEDVRGRDIYLVQPTCPPVNDHLMELLVMLDSFKRASPARITGVLPYYGNGREDRQGGGRPRVTPTRGGCRSRPRWWPASCATQGPTGC